jgi:hypothetical protein
MSTIEELLERKSSGSGLDRRESGRTDPKKLALSSPTGSGRSFDIVTWRTQDTEFSFKWEILESYSTSIVYIHLAVSVKYKRGKAKPVTCRGSP